MRSANGLGPEITPGRCPSRISSVSSFTHMPNSNILEVIPSALGLLVVVVVVTFSILLVATRLHRVIFGEKPEDKGTNALKGFLSNFE